MKIKVEAEISVDIYQFFERVGYKDQLFFYKGTYIVLMMMPLFKS